MSRVVVESRCTRAVMDQVPPGNGSSTVGAMYTALVTPLSDTVLEAIEVSLPNGANHVYGLLAATFLK